MHLLWDNNDELNSPLPSDHNLRGTTLPGLEVSRRGNKGSRTKLPISNRHAGDGGPRRWALSAGRWLLHSAPAPGRNLFMIFHLPHVKLVYTTHTFSLFQMPYLLLDSLLPSPGRQLKHVEPWHKCLTSSQLFCFLECAGSVLECVCWLALV